MSVTYKGSGVDYDMLDPFKRACQERARLTAGNARRLGYSSLEWSRGESVHLMWEHIRDDVHNHFGHVEEGLGTKNLVADAMNILTGKSYYDQIAQDTVAMIVNDMVTLGILPVTIAMHLAVGSNDWFADSRRAEDLVHGWGHACDLARAVWAGGETPTLKGIVLPEASLLSGSAFGVAPKAPFTSASICPGDHIVIVESSGVHANGLTMMRKIADGLPAGYLTDLPDGRMYGEALLDPTHIYVGVVEDCLDLGVNVHYAVNITGHGWRKFMRANNPFTYVIDRLPTQFPIFDFLIEHGVDEKEAYGNLNMGAGFALYAAESDVEKVLGAAGANNLTAFVAGYVEDGPRRVVVDPKGFEFKGDSLAVR